ncbi:MAG: helix-turn-helix domain-containing protein [Myxococcales bacterium]|nr:helix-turn-helix domain-containing protein [Myxococcales bacterium]
MVTNTLAAFLRQRRERLRPPSNERRRTPGLRREEVALRAGVSVTWYTWLEQGRGGTPSDDVLERLARALELDEANREVMFLLAHDRPPPRRIAAPGQVTPAVQRVLDYLPVPALIKTPTFQVVAWNPAATAVFGDYSKLPESERNLLRRIFSPGSENKVDDVDRVRRFCVAAFRVDLARAGETSEARALIDEMLGSSAAFRELWEAGEVRPHGALRKRLMRTGIGELVLESSVFLIDGSEGLSMFVWTPVNEASSDGLSQLLLRARG